MKRYKVVFWILGIAIVLMIGVGSWRFHLRPILYYDSDRSSIWKHEMSFVEKKSFWPVTTHYGVYRNGIIFVNGHKLSKNSWIEFVLWNSYGVDTIEVRGVTTDTLLYPTEKYVRSLNPDGIEIIVNFGQSTAHGGRYVIIGVKQSKGETRLRITVTDVRGNVTQDIVQINEI